MPKERPILFKPEMSYALTREVHPKNETRRLNGLDRVNESPNDYQLISLDLAPRNLSERNYIYVTTAQFLHLPTQATLTIPCPYGQPGDLLWVKEPWWRNDNWDRDPGSVALMLNGDGQTHHQIQVAHDGVSVWDSASNMAGCPSPEQLKAAGWVKRHPLFMYRWASRHLLEIINIRVERLQSITVASAIAEGIDPSHPDPVQAYQALWETINTEALFSWLQNPWVFVVQFRKLHRDRASLSL